MAIRGSIGKPPGLPKTGGRQKGTPNRGTLELREKLATLHCDPLEGLVTIAQDPQTPVGLKLQVFTTLMNYRYPKPTIFDNSEGEPPSGAPERMTAEQAIEVARDVLTVLRPDILRQTESASAVQDESAHSGDRVSAESGDREAERES
jgi:hypothetical protein